jgi:hypothetical protein
MKGGIKERLEGMEAAVKGKRIGRPIKRPQGKRAQITLQVNAEIKKVMSKRAHDAGHTLSREGELWLERLLTYENVLASMRTTVAELARRQAEKIYRDQGYSVIHDPHGDILLPPGHPATPPQSGFIPSEKEEKS